MSEPSTTLRIMRRIGAPEPKKIRITGMLQSPELAFLVLLLPEQDADILARLLSLLGEHEINIRFISTYTLSSGETKLNICIDGNALTKARELLRAQRAVLGMREVAYRPSVRVISLYPHKGRAEMAERLFTTLRLHGIELLVANNANSVISCVVSGRDLQNALSCLEQAFELP
jgi:aspartokinase